MRVMFVTYLLVVSIGLAYFLDPRPPARVRGVDAQVRA